LPSSRCPPADPVQKQPWQLYLRAPPGRNRVPDRAGSARIQTIE